MKIGGLSRVALWVGLLGMSLMFAPAVAAEKIPALKPIPKNLPDEQRAKFTQERQSLETELAKFLAAADAFNAKAAKDQNDAEYGAIQTQRTQYIKAAKAFNETLAEAVCYQVTQLQNEFRSLNAQIDLNRQALQNYGFEKTVDEIEYWGSLPARQVEDAKKAFKSMLFDATLDSVSKAAGAVGSLTPDEAEALKRLAGAQGAPLSGIVAGANDLHNTLEFLDKTKSAYEVADAIKKRQMLDAAVTLGGLASKNPAFGLLLTADEWATYQFYQSATAWKRIHDLTEANEGDLILLKSRSEELKNEVNQLTEVKKQLAKLSPECDSSNFVKKPE